MKRLALGIFLLLVVVTFVNSQGHIYNYPATGGGTGVWGLITGTISDQTDLQTALNTKVTEPTGTGYVAKTAAGSYSTRSITSSDGSLVVTNGDGVSGNTDVVIDNTPFQLVQNRLSGRGASSGTGMPEAITVGSGLTLSGTTLSASGASFDPLDTTTVWYRDDFGTGVVGTTGGWGIGWFGSSVASGTCGMSHAAGTFPNLGISTVSSGATANGGCVVSLAGDTFGNMGGNTNWDSYYILKLNNISNDIFRVGYADASSAVIQNDGFWLRFLSASDTNWQFCARTGGGSETCYDSGVAANTNYHKIRIRSTEVGKILFTLDAGTERSLCAVGCDATITVTTADLTPWFVMATDTTGSKSLNIDLFAFRATSLSR